MKTELLTFQTTVCVTYDPARPKTRCAAIKLARNMLRTQASCYNGVDDVSEGRVISASSRPSVYRPKVPYQAPYHRMDGVDR